MSEKIKFYDVSLRDGNHALRHQLPADFAKRYAALSSRTQTWALEVGHGNGLGGSSHLVGKSAETDHSLLQAARSSLPDGRLAVHLIPGFATISRDVNPAVQLGVDVFRVAAHASEADVCQSHIEHPAALDVAVHGVLMMSHTVSWETLVAQALKLVEFGARAVVIMDSAGHYRPNDVASRVRALVDATGVEIGFHAHNNLGMATANALAAIEAGATIIDVSSRGLGAGAGNLPFELIALAMRLDKTDPTELKKILNLADLVTESFSDFMPQISASSIRSGLLGVFSGYAPQISQLSDEFGIPAERLWVSAASRNLVAGQESMLREIAEDLANL